MVMFCMDLKKMRCKSKITIAKMSLYMHVPRKMISLWESGEIPMTPDEYEKYIRILSEYKVR